MARTRGGSSSASSSGARAQIHASDAPSEAPSVPLPAIVHPYGTRRASARLRARTQTSQSPPAPKRARLSGPGESSRAAQTTTEASAPAVAHRAEIIREPIIPALPLQGNSDCRDRPFHDELFFDHESLRALPELQDSYALIQRYHLEPLMTPRDFFYPRVVLDFYQSMTTRGARSPVAIHFSIDGRHGVLEARHIAEALHIPVMPADLTSFRHWSAYTELEQVQALSRGRVSGKIIMRRELPSRMLLIDLVLRTNLFPLQHRVQRRGAILDALYRISEGFYLGPQHLIMASLFYFEEKVHRRHLQRAEGIPLLFPRLLCHVLEHMGYPADPHLERRRLCRDTFTSVSWAQFVERSPLIEDPRRAVLPEPPAPPLPVPAEQSVHPLEPTPSAPAPTPQTPVADPPVTQPPVATHSTPVPQPPAVTHSTPVAESSSAIPTITHDQYRGIITLFHTLTRTHTAIFDEIRAIRRQLDTMETRQHAHTAMIAELHRHLGILPPASAEPSIPADDPAPAEDPTQEIPHPPPQEPDS